LWSLRGDLEAVRAEHRELSLRVQRGELEELAAAVDRLFTEGRRLRDRWQRAAESLGLRARLLRDRETFKAAAVTELTRAGLLA
jgi:molecular chaperone GrpE (heat shock protein)